MRLVIDPSYRTVEETTQIIARRITAGDWSPARIAAEIHAGVAIPFVEAIAVVPADVGVAPIYDQLVTELALDEPLAGAA